MFGVSGSKNVGAFIKPVTGIFPVNSAAGTVEGPGIDRFPDVGKQFDSCVLKLARGQDSGGADPHSVAAILEESSVQDDGATWSAIAGASIAALTVDDTEAQVDVDLTGAKRYIRVVAVVTLTAGSSPKLPFSADIILGGPKELPV